MTRSENEAVPCPVCAGSPMSHGPHDWRFDKYSLTGPVVWRCGECNATTELMSRESWRRAAPGSVAAGFTVKRNRLLPAGAAALTPCDVCDGTGIIAKPDEAYADHIRFLVARRAARSRTRLMPPRTPLIYARNLAVMTLCPRCGKNDRTVPMIQTIGMDEKEALLNRLGEAVIDFCTGTTAHYCGRCDLEFGDAAVEFLAGLGR